MLIGNGGTSFSSKVSSYPRSVFRHGAGGRIARRASRNASRQLIPYRKSRGQRIYRRNKMQEGRKEGRKEGSAGATAGLPSSAGCRNSPALLDKPTVAPEIPRHCWTSQQWHPAWLPSFRDVWRIGSSSFRFSSTIQRATDRTFNTRPEPEWAPVSAVS